MPAIRAAMLIFQVMNALGDHSMATRRAFVPFQDLRPELDVLLGGDWSALDGFPEWARCRLVAMRPGGPVARLMAAHAVCMKVGGFLRGVGEGRGGSGGKVCAVLVCRVLRYGCTYKYV